MATFTVTTTSDLVDPNDGRLSLREALALADADLGTADTIDFAPEVQGGRIVLAGSHLTAASDVTIDGGAGVTLDANQQSRVLLVHAGSEDDPNDVALANVTITGGHTTDEGGGGVHADAQTTLSLSRVNVSGNATSGSNADGGGIYGERITLSNCTVSDNNSAGSGGGIIGGYSVALTDTLVSNNSGNTLGGGVRCIGAITAINSEVIDNRVAGSFAQGGGIFAGNVQLNYSIVRNNEAVAASGGLCEGGGVYGISVTLTDSTVDGNRTNGGSGQGGGISGSYIDIKSSTISNNAVTNSSSTAIDVAKGGGIYAVDHATLTNSTIAGNAVTSEHAQGGGVYARFQNVALVNTTVSGNSAAGANTDGGGIFLYGGYGSTATTVNSIVAGNSVTHGSSADIAGHISSSNGLNIFGSDVDGNLPSDRENVSVNILFADGLAGHGGPTQTIALLDDPVNPALGRADPTQAPMTDQRGEARPQPAGTNPDIGAFELDQSHPSPPPVPQTFIVTTARDVVDRTDGHLSLREALALADRDPLTADRIEFAPQVQGCTITLRGGQLTVASDVTIDGGTGVTVDAHRASRALLAQGLGTDLQLQHLTITGGHTTGDYSGGGGIHADSFTTLMLDYVAVRNNSTAGDNARGGGIDGDKVTLSNSTVSGNSTTGSIAGGGGVFANYVTLTNSSVTGNDTADSGGGIFGDVALNNSTVCGNTAASIGGGIFGSGMLTNSTVADNSAEEFAGGISGSNWSLSNCTIVGNIGGGIFGDGALNSCTIANNTGFGVEVSSFEQLQINNTIIVGSDGNDVIAGGDGPGTVVSNGHNIFGSGVLGAASGDLQNVPTSLLFAGHLADHGGPTETLALRRAADNPALGGADPADSPAVDQRGEVRPQPAGTAPDIGAFESAWAPATPARPFDGLEYIASYRDLIQAFGPDSAAGFTHYHLYGAGEGRTVRFDGLQYIASYGDLIQALGADADAGAIHFITHGEVEGRVRDHFDAKQYLANYSDLQAAFGHDTEAATVHYIEHGYEEGRTDQPLHAHAASDFLL